MFGRLGSQIRQQSLGLGVAIIALFVALGGPGFAASLLDGSRLADRSVPGRKLKKNTVTGKEVRESKLGTVPQAKSAGMAANADKLDNLDSTSFASGRCATGMSFFEGVCIETAARPNQNFNDARTTCNSLGRTLPTLSELDGFRMQPSITLGDSEWVTDFTWNMDHQTVIAIADNGAISQASPSFLEPFRCVAPPSQ